jgi:hypothetical protein
MARQHSSMGSLEVSGIVALTLGLGMFVLGASAVAVILFVLLAGGLVSFGRARAYGWSAERLGVTAAVLVAVLLFGLVGWGVARLVGVLVVGFGALLAWHAGVGQRTRKL